MSKNRHFEPVDDSDSESESEVNEENVEGEEDDEEEEDDSESDLSDVPPVLRSIVTKGEVDNSQQNEDAEREAIKQELSSLSFEELQKIKQKLGSKKFEQTLKGKAPKKQDDEAKETNFKRANKNRPREMSSKIKRIEIKSAIQVPKVFRNDPRFDSLCGEFNEKKFNRNYEFVSKIKEEELAKLKEDVKEETNPRQVEKIKYLIQRMENQLRAEKKRKEEEDKKAEERQAQIEAMKQGISPHFTSKAVKKKQLLREKFDKLKKDGKLDSYMSKKRKQNAQRDRKYLPNQKS